MRLKSKKIPILILLTTIALAGLLFFQFYLIRESYNLKMQAFRQNVQSALNDMVSKLEIRETAARIIAFNLGEALPADSARKRTIRLLENNLKESEGDSICLNTGQIQIQVLDSGEQEMIRILERVPGLKENLKDTLTTEEKAKGFTYKMINDSTGINVDIGMKGTVPRLKHMITDDNRKLVVEKVIEDLNLMAQKPLIERLKGFDMDSLTRATLAEKGIQLPYSWGIINTSKDSILLCKHGAVKAELLRSPFKSRLFPNDLVVLPNYLSLFFPDMTLFIIRQSAVPVLLSLLFILIIIFSFYYTIQAIHKQTRFSRTLTAFINNMTHEFKTPISTVSLAADTLLHQDMQKNPDRLDKYGRIIFDESTRMKEQVEKILQMAAVEEGKVKLNISLIDVHSLLGEVIKTMTVNVESHGGKIELILQALQPFIRGDKVHLQNIFHNIIDNAIKYRRGKPDISIRTSTTDGNLKIEFEDHGIGIKTEDQKRVFEKYYRVPTGNVHDVKGFGLGLSYVNLMMHAHGGTVNLNSHYLEGTTITLAFPLAPSDSNNQIFH